MHIITKAHCLHHSIDITKCASIYLPYFTCKKKIMMLNNFKLAVVLCLVEDSKVKVNKSTSRT